MILQPDEPARGDRATPGGAGAASEHAAGSPAANRWSGPGSSAEMTEEQVWVLASIVLALVALSGSVLLLAVVVVVGSALWLLSTPPPDPPAEGRDPFRCPPGGPFGGPGLMR